MLKRREVIQLLTHAAVFVCPSVYEPLGIVNLEAMACETAVVATATGGIPEVVVNGETGLLVPFETAAPAAPATRSASPPTSPKASTASSPAPPWPTAWARRDAAAPSSSSAGPPSPARPPPSTPASSRNRRASSSWTKRLGATVR